MAIGGPPKRIYKYILPRYPGMFVQAMPPDFQPLSLQSQHGGAVVWGLTAKDPVNRVVHVVVTGAYAPRDVAVIPLGTVQFDDGYLVLHYFLEVVA